MRNKQQDADQIIFKLWRLRTNRNNLPAEVVAIMDDHLKDIDKLISHYRAVHGISFKK